MNLVAVQDGMLLDAPTAYAWRALVRDVYAAHRVTLTITTPGGAYRSDDMVRDMYLNKAKYRIPASQPVAKPRSLGGNGSVHENGRCIDIWNHNSVPRASLVELATRHGFRFTIATEPWHIQHDGATSGGGDGGATPLVGRKRRTMSTLYTTVFSTAVPMPQRVKDHAARCGTPITNTAGRVFALMGDSPGTPANVIITQENRFANELAADHTGAIPGLVEQGARVVSPDIFVTLFDAYLDFRGGSTQVSVPADVATKTDIAASEQRIKDAIPTKAVLS